jgi:signal transduction histidine kinase
VSTGVTFAVNDTGIGMPGDMRVRPFQDFAPADESATCRCGGMGLGLALRRRLCALLGTRVEVESTLGVGSTFTRRVPRQSPIDVVAAGGIGRSAASVGGAR